jgi:hypothetical protein
MGIYIHAIISNHICHRKLQEHIYVLTHDLYVKTGQKVIREQMTHSIENFGMTYPKNRTYMRVRNLKEWKITILSNTGAHVHFLQN